MLRQDGAGDANFNVLPDTKTTLAMIDGPEDTTQRTRDTSIMEHDGMPVSSITTGQLWETNTIRKNFLARLPLSAPPPNIPLIYRGAIPPARTRSLSPTRRSSLKLHPDYPGGQRMRAG